MLITDSHNRILQFNFHYVFVSYHLLCVTKTTKTKEAGKHNLNLKMFLNIGLILTLG